MPTISVQGELQIDLIDLYSWLRREGHMHGEVIDEMHFIAGQDTLQLTFADTETPGLVDAEDLWAWIIGEQLPIGLGEYEVAFGIPRIMTDGSEVMNVTFAASNECDPHNWAVRPPCVLEWDMVATTPQATLPPLKVG